jgi:hypothetical protein
MKQKFSSSNLNHHLWNNNGIWFIQYTIYPSHNTKERIRRSLGTRCVKTARTYRDEILSEIEPANT